MPRIGMPLTLGLASAPPPNIQNLSTPLQSKLKANELNQSLATNRKTESEVGGRGLGGPSLSKA